MTISMVKKAFCRFCGSLLGEKHVEGRLRLHCDECGLTNYQNPVPASALVVVDSRGRLLLVKRNVEPKIGMWCLPGGFMEIGEQPEECALRELAEETALKGRIEGLLGLTSSSNSDYGTVLLMGYLVREYSGEPAPGDDAQEVAFFPPDDLPEIAFDSHKRFVRIYLAGYRIEKPVY
ncbi:NUDIX hydrolase [Desulfatibacillum aliphaticivorans]|nr:NUDIX hydrolase [Desulfatibacillum aliphaticivorans]